MNLLLTSSLNSDSTGLFCVSVIMWHFILAGMSKLEYSPFVALKPDLC